MSDESIASAPPVEYTVVFRARSSARFLPEEGWERVLDVPRLELEGVRVRAFTRWVGETGMQVPRELILEVRGREDSLDDAIVKFGAVAHPVATMVGFVANVQVGALDLHLGFDSTPSSGDRQFLEMFNPDEQGLIPEGRIIRRDLLEAACTALMTLQRDSARINRALRHYELALRYWYVGGEWLALNHLWIAAENLTKAAIRKTIASRGISEEELAHEYDLVTDDPERPRWRQLLDARAREALIFGGDTETYKAAKDASDGLEHGIWELNQVAANALRYADLTFRHVRRSIVDLLGLAPEAADELTGIRPKDVQSLRKVVRGRLVGTAEDPAMEGELYPRLEWRSGVGSVVRDGSTFSFQQTEQITVRTHPQVAFHLERLEVRGRLEDGQVPVDLSRDGVTIEHTTPSPSQRLLESIMPLVDTAAAAGLNVAQNQPLMFAFNMFGQATALFQGTKMLIDGRLPVEALASLRGLVVIAARFEQMAAPDGPGLGVAVRGVINALGASGADADRVATRTRELITTVQEQGLDIPDQLKPVESSSIYNSLRVEMNFATELVNGTYSTAVLHQQRVGDQGLRFRISLDPSPLTDLVSSAAVIAMLSLLSHAAQLFGWTIRPTDLDDLRAEAMTVNETASQLNLFPGEIASPVDDD